MKILFVMDSPEYLRFYDSVIEEFAARGHDVAIGVTTRGVKKRRCCTNRHWPARCPRMPPTISPTRCQRPGRNNPRAALRNS